jgi:capsid protein
VLWWNEGNAVAVYDALKEAKDSVVQIKGGVATPST